LIVLAFTSRKSRAPKAEGIPYDKATRWQSFIKSWKKAANAAF
jgi:hypothetical protein